MNKQKTRESSRFQKIRMEVDYFFDNWKNTFRLLRLIDWKPRRMSKEAKATLKQLKKEYKENHKK